MLDLLAQTTYYVTTTSTSSDSGMSAGVIWAIVLIALVFAVLSIVALWKIFEKAGEAGWKAIIPYYNIWVLLEVSGKPGWWFLVGLIPFVGGLIWFILYILAALELAKRFNKSTVFAVFGLIIFSVIGHLILGFGSAQYTGKVYRTFEPNGAQ